MALNEEQPVSPATMNAVFKLKLQGLSGAKQAVSTSKARVRREIVAKGELRACRSLRGAGAFIAILMCVSLLPVFAQDAAPRGSNSFTAEGKVVDADGKPVSDADVQLVQGRDQISIARTDALGRFAFAKVAAGSYTIRAERAGLRGSSNVIVDSSQGYRREIDLTLESGARQPPVSAASAPPAQPMEFTDEPKFEVAGVTDWTAAGGHGSDSGLRTSEALVRETITLEAGDLAAGRTKTKNSGDESASSESRLRAALDGDRGGFEANRQLGRFYLHEGKPQEALQFLQTAYDRNPKDEENEYDLAVAYERVGELSRAHRYAMNLQQAGHNGDWESLAGEVDEKLGDPVSAVRAFEQAVLLAPTEANYFNWGSELLLHRAVLQAADVFARGAQAYPRSLRMLSALGAALFAGARYDEAALRLCEASDLDPADPKPYEFMAKINMAAPTRLPCIVERLSRFHHQQPDNSLANYFYAMAIWKGRETSTDRALSHEVETLLTKAVTLDPKCAEGYLQLGDLSSSQLEYAKAVGYYLRAIDANPRLAEAHYRLGVAYDRTGKHDLAAKEFKLHDEIKKSQAEEVEKGRREIKQFVVVIPNEPARAPAP
jgi:tetratricopeptide (TPR) repeat protein